MTSFGLDSGVGFLQKMVDDIVADLEDAERAAFGAGINTSATSVFGQLNGVFAGAAAENWEVLNEVYASFNPNTAINAALDRLANLTGVVRLPATLSSMLSTNAIPNQLTLTGDDGTTLLAGRVVSVTASGARFDSQTDVSLALATARATTTAYVLGDIRSNGGNIYVVIIAGTTDGGGGPTSEIESIVDGTVTWRFVGNGLAFANVDCLAEQFGPVAATSAVSRVRSPVPAVTSETVTVKSMPGTASGM